MGGIIVIGIGVIFLLQNLGVIVRFDNWWALFILIPAVTSFWSGWEAYRMQRRFSRAVSGPLTTGCLFLFVALIFLFNWPWDAVWPVFIIIIGLGIMLGWRSP
jgi:CDP-diglyceride synthetase